MGTNFTIIRSESPSMISDGEVLASAFLDPAYQRNQTSPSNFVGASKGVTRQTFINFRDCSEPKDAANATFGPGNHTLSVVPVGDNVSVEITNTTNTNPTLDLKLIFAGIGVNVDDLSTYADIDVSLILPVLPATSISPGNNQSLFIDINSPNGEAFPAFPQLSNPQLFTWVNMSAFEVTGPNTFAKKYFINMTPGEAAFLLRSWWENPTIVLSFALPFLAAMTGLTRILSVNNAATDTRPKLFGNYAIKPVAVTINAVPIGTPVIVKPGDTIIIVGTDLMVSSLPLIDFGLTRDVIGPHSQLVEALPGATSTLASYIVPASAAVGVKSISLVRRETGVAGGTYTNDYVDAVDYQVTGGKQLYRNVNRTLNAGLN